MKHLLLWSCKLRMMFRMTMTMTSTVMWNLVGPMKWLSLTLPYTTWLVWICFLPPPYPMPDAVWDSAEILLSLSRSNCDQLHEATFKGQHIPMSNPCYSFFFSFLIQGVKQQVYYNGTPKAQIFNWKRKFITSNNTDRKHPKMTYKTNNARQHKRRVAG